MKMYSVGKHVNFVIHDKCDEIYASMQLLNQMLCLRGCRMRAYAAIRLHKCSNILYMSEVANLPYY